MSRRSRFVSPLMVAITGVAGLFGLEPCRSDTPRQVLIFLAPVQTPPVVISPVQTASPAPGWDQPAVVPAPVAPPAQLLNTSPGANTGPAPLLMRTPAAAEPGSLLDGNLEALEAVRLEVDGLVRKLREGGLDDVAIFIQVIDDVNRAYAARAGIEPAKLDEPERSPDRTTIRRLIGDACQAPTQAATRPPSALPGIPAGPIPSVVPDTPVVSDGPAVPVLVAVPPFVGAVPVVPVQVIALRRHRWMFWRR